MLKLYRTPFLLALALFLCACAGTPEMAALRVIFPLPPETPRVEWLGTYQTEDDLIKTEQQRRVRKFLGSMAEAKLYGPSGIVADSTGKIYVSDLYLKQIFVIDLQAEKISELLKDSPLESARQLTIDSRSQLYVADSGRKQVLVFSTAGKFLRTYGKPGELGSAMGVAIDEARRRLYVSDVADSQVVAYALDSGEKLFAIKSEEGGSWQLRNPNGLTVHPDGRLFVVDQFHARVLTFSPDGTFLKFFGERDDTPRGLESPRSASFDSEGNLWLADFRRGAVRVYTPEGVLLLAIGGEPTHKLGFASPAAVYVNAADEIFIADFIAKRVSHWRYLSKAVLARHPLTEAELQRINREILGKGKAGK